MARIIGHDAPTPFAGHIVIGKKRSHEQDPRYALKALRESASKALSPGINDPGTAVEIVARLERLLWASFEPLEEAAEVVFDRIHVRDLDHGALLKTSFYQIARDGKHLVSVIGGTRRAVLRLSERLEQEDAVATLLEDIDAHAQEGLSTDGERRRYDEFRKLPKTESS